MENKIYEVDFREACKCGDLDKLENIVQALDDDQLDYILNNGIGYSNGTPLFGAVMDGQTAVVRYLIELESDLETECDVNIIYPMAYNDVGPVLCAATASGNYAVVETLINAAADVNHASRFATPLSYACKYGYNEIVTLLLGNDACPNTKLPSGKSMLHVACESYDNTMLVRLLLAHGADVAALDNSGKLPLYYACLEANCDMAELLLQHEDMHLSRQDMLEHLWLLGATCASCKSCDDAVKYWLWAADDDACNEHYRYLIKKKLTDDQIQSSIASASFSVYDVERMSRDSINLRSHALVLLSLLLEADDPLLHMLYPELVSDVIKNCFMSHSLLQLVTYGNGLIEKCTKPNRASDCLCTLVDGILNQYETHELEILNHSDVEQTLYVILNQLIYLSSRVFAHSSSINDASHDSLASESPSDRFVLREVLHELIECILAVTRLIFVFSHDSEYRVMHTLIPVLASFLASVVNTPLHLDDLLWQLLIDSEWCRFSLIWVYNALFPNVAIISAFLYAGLNVNARDKHGQTPLHICLSTKLCDRNILNTLLEAGASVDLPDINGKRPCDLMSSSGFSDIDILKYRGLKSFAAETIIRNNVPYQSLPRALLEYVQERQY